MRNLIDFLEAWGEVTKEVDWYELKDKWAEFEVI